MISFLMFEESCAQAQQILGPSYFYTSYVGL